MTLADAERIAEESLTEGHGKPWVCPVHGHSECWPNAKQSLTEAELARYTPMPYGMRQR